MIRHTTLFLGYEHFGKSQKEEYTFEKKWKKVRERYEKY